MRDLYREIDRTIESRKLPWTRKEGRVDVELWPDGRRQKVQISHQGSLYRFWSVVANRRHLPSSNKAIRDLTYRAWRKNDLKDLVTFSFDNRERLIGVIEQPIESLHREELVLYIETLARECDRFEYQILGSDRE